MGVSFWTRENYTGQIHLDTTLLSDSSAITHGHTIIYRHLFAGHVVGSQPVKRKNHASNENAFSFHFKHEICCWVVCLQLGCAKRCFHRQVKSHKGNIVCEHTSFIRSKALQKFCFVQNLVACIYLRESTVLQSL